MDQKLHRWIQMMRQSKCPKEVHRKVRQRIELSACSDRTRISGLFAWTEPAGVALTVLILCMLIVFQWNPKTSNTFDLQKTQTINRELMALEAKQSLVLLGDVLIEAGRLTEASLRREMEPTLHRSFSNLQQIIKKKGITNEE